MVKVTIGYRRSTTPPLRSETGATTSWAVPVLCGLVALAPFNVAPLTGDSRLVVVLRPLIILQLLISIVVVAAVFRTRSDAASALPNGLKWSAGVLMVMVSVSAALSNDQVIGAGGAATAMAFAATVVAGALVVRTQHDGLRLLRWLVGGATLGAVIGLLVLANDDEFWFTEPLVGGITNIGLTPRLTRPWSHANIAAMAMGPAAAILAVAVASGRVLWHRASDLLVLVVLVVALVLTYSRGGLVGALVAISLGVIFVARRFGRGPAAAGLLVAVFGLVGVTMAIAPGWADRLTTDTFRDDFDASITPPADLKLGANGETVTVNMQNLSSRPWAAQGSDRIQLSARFLVSNTDRIADEQLWPLPKNVEPGGTVAVTVPVEQRLPDGRYDVLWDLLLDQEAYFLQFSSRSATSTITVVDSPVDEETSADTPLVTPRANLSRLELWRIAWSAFADRPTFGVGPMQLAAYAEPQLSDEQRFPGAHAHNLPLEALATWGLLGALPLFVILVGGAYRAWRSALRGDNIGLAVLAGLIASGIHATVEWQINEVSAALPMALLLGIGWTTTEVRPTGTEGEKNERDGDGRAVPHPVP